MTFSEYKAFHYDSWRDARDDGTSKYFPPPIEEYQDYRRDMLNDGCVETPEMNKLYRKDANFTGLADDIIGGWVYDDDEEVENERYIRECGSDGNELGFMFCFDGTNVGNMRAFFDSDEMSSPFNDNALFERASSLGLYPSVGGDTARFAAFYEDNRNNHEFINWKWRECMSYKKRDFLNFLMDIGDGNWTDWEDADGMEMGERLKTHYSELLLLSPLPVQLHCQFLKCYQEHKDDPLIITAIEKFKSLAEEI